MPFSMNAESISAASKAISSPPSDRSADLGIASPQSSQKAIAA